MIVFSNKGENITKIINLNTFLCFKNARCGACVHCFEILYKNKVEDFFES